MKARRRSNSSYAKLLGILLSIAIIPCLLISGLAYYVSIENAKKQAVTYSGQYLDLIVESHSALLQQAKGLLYELMLNYDNYSEILRLKPQSADAHNLVQALEKKKLSSDSYLKTFYFVDNRSRIVYTSADSSIYTFDDYPDTGLLNLLEQPNDTLRLNDLFPRKTGNGDQIASYVVRYPLTGPAYGYLIVDLDLSHIVNPNGDGRDYGGHLLMRNSHGDLVNLDQEAWLERVKTHPGDFVVIRDRSADAGLTYEFAIPRSRITADNRLLLLSILSICAVIVLLEAVAAWFSSKRLYTPLNNLVNYIRQLAPEQEEQEQAEPANADDEYHYVRRVVTRMNLQNTDYMKTFHANGLLFKQRQLSRLLLGETSAYRRMVVPDKLRLRFARGAFTVMVLEAGGSEEFKERRTALEQELLLYAVTNIAEELLRKECEAFSAPIDAGRAVVLINHDALYEGASFEELGRQLQEQVRHYLKLTLSIGIGGSCSSEEEIPRSYEQAQRALSHKVYYGIGSILNADKLSDAPDSQRKLVSWADIRERLKIRLQSSEWEPAREMIAELAGASAFVGMTETDLQLFYLQFTGCLSDLCAEFSVPFEELTESGGLAGLSAARIASVAELAAEMEALTLRLHERIQSTKDHIHQELIEQILHYITEHLDQDLTLEAIAEKVYMHPAYLSRICKSLTGKGLGEQIVQARVDRAKHLLSGTNKSINDISAMIGYTNPRAFYRLFKDYTGLTPGEFRKREGLKNVK